MITGKGERPADTGVVVLAGGNMVELQGKMQPKACVKVSGRSLLDHTLSHYQKFGYRKFIICTGLGHEMILAEAENLRGSTSRGGKDSVQILVKPTGESSGTAQRLRLAMEEAGDPLTLAVTYVDTISNVNSEQAREVHSEEKAAVTLTAVHLPTRFKALGVDLFSSRVRGFASKPITENTLVCGGFYFLSPSQLLQKAPDFERSQSFENEILPFLAMSRSLAYYRHEGAWQSIDSGRDIRISEEILAAMSSN